MIVWQNTFDGTPGTSVTVANSSTHGDPIADLRNDPPSEAVRYGGQAVAGSASLMLGTDDAAAHGDVWLHYPEGNEYSLSFYLYLPRGAWFRARDANNLLELYLATDSTSYLGGREVPEDVLDQVYDRWVRVESSVTDEWMESRLYWSDIHTGGEADYEAGVGRDGGTLGGIFAQGSGSEDAPVAYMDQVRLGEGEWVGPWLTHHTTSAEATLTLAADPADSEADHHEEGATTASAVLPLTGHADSRRHARVSAHGDITLWGTADSTRHATSGASADLGELVAEEATTTRGGTTSASAELTLTAEPVDSRNQFRPTFPPRLTTELLLDEEWVDISGDVRAEEPVQIIRGRADEAAQADPSTCSLTLDNRAGRYSPHNPLSPYYGMLGKNTPLRVRVGPLPDEGETVLTDSFDRTVTDGWGTADSGQEWQVFTGPDGAYSVDGGAGRIALDSIAQHRTVHTDVEVADFDLTCAVSMDTPPRGAAGGAIYLSFQGRTDPHTTGEDEDLAGGYRFNVTWRVDAGAGVRIAPDISRADGASASDITPPGAPIPDMEYTPGDWVRVRAQAVGPELRVRVWPDGAPEPQVWHAQGHDKRYTQGGLGVRGTITGQAGMTATPATVSVRDIHVRNLWEQELPDVIRFTGEVSAWPARWDTSGSDVTAPVQASGILRRLGQGSAPVRSVLRRAIPTYMPVAYWPMEEGQTARFAVSPLAGVQPMRVTGLYFADDDSLGVSRPLPTVGEEGATITAPIPHVTGMDGWEVNLLAHIPEEPDIPADPDGEYELFTVESTELRATAQLLNLGTDDEQNLGFRWRLFTHDGDEIDGLLFSLETVSPKPWGGWRRLSIRGESTASGSEVSVRWYESGTSTAPTAPRLSHAGPVGVATGVVTEVDPVFEGMAVGHVGAWATTEVTAYSRPVDGWVGETARQRLSRLGADFGVPVLVSGSADEQMGAEEEGTFLDVVGQAMESDLGAPGEDRASLALTYTGRDRMYTSEPALVLDYMGGEISPPMEPEDDDQALRNDVEVTRSGGVAVQVEDTDGPLGVDRVGRYDESVTLSLATDSQAEDQAGWRLHLGTVNELRWPVIHLNLANPRLSARIEDVLALDAGDRIRILNPPPWTQERALDLIVQGYEEAIGLFQWDITLTCTPASPWQVGQIGEEETEAPADAPMRADTAGAEIDYSLDETETLLIVSTTHGPAWVTSDTRPDCFPFDITVGGEIMRVTGIVGTGESVGQSVEVERAINGVAKNHGAGTPVRLAYPATAAL